jgi:hypothetical protein
LNSTKLEKDYYRINTGLSKIYVVDMDSEEIPDDINIHKKIWGKNADEVMYGGTEGAKKKGEGTADNTEQERCIFCDSRIDEFGYCACGGSSG